MNLAVKSAVGAALALGASGAANALGIPSLNSSDLVFVLQNETTPSNVYILDTGISLNTAMSGTLVSGAVLNTSLAGVNATIPNSATLAAFLAANPLSGDAWAIEGGQYSGGTATASPTNAATKTAGKAFGVFTSVTTPANIGPGVQLAAFQSFLGGIQGDLTAPIDSLGLHPLLGCGALCDASTGASYTTTGGTSAASKYALFGSNTDDRTPPGQLSATLYGMTGNGTTGQVQTYILGTASINANDQLVFAGNTQSAVPIPAAVWLFGSGLMGLVGISRRRKTAA